MAIASAMLTYLMHNQLLHLQQYGLRVKFSPRPRTGGSQEEANMEFGYFTLSDNHYENNPRDANQFISDITAEALYADQLGMHSAWIGEHHFNSLGVLSFPNWCWLYRSAHQAHPPRARGQRDASAPSDPRRRAMGDARSALQRPGRFRFRPRLRQPRVCPVRRFVRRQPEHLRRRHGDAPEALERGRHASPITASTTSSRTCASRRSRSRSLYRSISARSQSPRSS